MKATRREREMPLRKFGQAGTTSRKGLGASWGSSLLVCYHHHRAGNSLGSIDLRSFMDFVELLLPIACNNKLHPSNCMSELFSV